jgi:uncharacterized protein (TIGR02466 family)
MDRTIENLFSTPIYSCFLKNQDDVQTEIANALVNIQYDDSANYDKWTDTFKTTNPTADIIAEKQMQNLADAIDEHLEEYCGRIGFTPRSYRRISWIVKNSRGGNTMSHTHAEYDMAGVYYYQTNGNDGNIFFESPVGQTISSLCYQKYSERWKHKPAVGKLLLFPGWLAHGVETNTTDSDRISLAFSIAFSR